MRVNIRQTYTNAYRQADRQTNGRTYMLAYIHTYIYKDRQTDRQTGRQTGRQTDRQGHVPVQDEVTFLTYVHSTLASKRVNRASLPVSMTTKLSDKTSD